DNGAFAIFEGDQVLVLVETFGQVDAGSEAPDRALRMGAGDERWAIGKVPVGAAELALKIARDANAGDPRIGSIGEEQLELDRSTGLPAADLPGAQVLAHVVHWRRRVYVNGRGHSRASPRPGAPGGLSCTYGHPHPVQRGFNKVSAHLACHQAVHRRADRSPGD